MGISADDGQPHASGKPNQKNRLASVLQPLATRAAARRGSAH